VNLGPETPTGDEDPIIITRDNDHVLWESGIRTVGYPETVSGQLTVRMQVFGYLAFTAGRYPAKLADLPPDRLGRAAISAIDLGNIPQVPAGHRSVGNTK
jgi:hypothetical protein